MRRNKLIFSVVLCLLSAGVLLPFQGCSGAAPIPEHLIKSDAPAVAQTRKKPRADGTVPAVRSGPPEKGGKPGSYGKSFAALQKYYNLSAVPTYDGSNQCTHPKLLYFPRGWNGYRYWMSVTPYPYGIDKVENPSIVVSNDMKTWIVPDGLKNPVTGIPKDVKYGGHYSDSQLVMHGNTMELWYRVNKGNQKTRQPDYRMDYYYRITSTDGVHWTGPVLMQNSPFSILSLVVNYEGGKYEFWYTNESDRLYHAESPNGTVWENTQACSVPLPEGYTPWHQDLIKSNGVYYLLQTAKYHKKYSFSLFLSESADGIHFSKGVSFYPSDNSVILHQAWLYRSTLIDDNGTFDMMISVRLPGQQWYLMKCSMPVSEWQSACANQKPVVLKGPSPGSSVQSLKKLKTERKSVRQALKSPQAAVKKERAL